MDIEPPNTNAHTHKSIIAYSRVSSSDQSVESQKQEIGARYNVSKWFEDHAISGAIRAKDRPGFRQLLDYVREDDALVVYSVDRLGRNTIDVLETVETLQRIGVSIISVREGFDLSTSMGKAMLAMLSAVAELERSNIKDRQMAGLKRFRAEGGRLGRTKTIDDHEVAKWRLENSASIKEAACYFGISTSSVKRACRQTNL